MISGGWECVHAALPMLRPLLRWGKVRRFRNNNYVPDYMALICRAAAWATPYIGLGRKGADVGVASVFFHSVLFSVLSAISIPVNFY